MQARLPAPAYKPALQAAHVVKPEAPKLPGAHHWHAADAVAPVAAAAVVVPALHEVQLALPLALWYWPAAQLAHSDAPAAEALPTGQRAHTLELLAPSARELEPAAQLVQLEEPVPDWYLPAAQLVHVPAPAAENRPAAQSGHTEPVAPPWPRLQVGGVHEQQYWGPRACAQERNCGINLLACGWGDGSELKRGEKKEKKKSLMFAARFFFEVRRLKTLLKHTSAIGSTCCPRDMPCSLRRP